MKYTNKHSLPDAFCRAVIADPYSKGESDFTATGLQQPPRATVLIETRRDELEVDVSSRVASIIGSGAHGILERAQRAGVDTIEKRFIYPLEVDGIKWKISAQIDLYEEDTQTLYDWKTTKAFAFHRKNQAKPEWLAQMNIGAWLLRKYAFPVKSIMIIGLLKDWDERKAQVETGYPPTEVMGIELKMWTEDETVSYITERIRAILQARTKLPLCTSSETWGGNRCRRWCDANSVCEQYQQGRRKGLLHAAQETILPVGV